MEFYNNLNQLTQNIEHNFYPHFRLITTHVHIVNVVQQYRVSKLLYINNRLP